MPALAKTPEALPRFVPHPHGASAGAGDSSRPEPKPGSKPGPKPITGPSPESLDRLAHDARNIVSGLMVYCGLLTAPGVLAEPYAHFAPELETVAKNVAQILEKVVQHASLHASPHASGPALPAASVVPVRTLPVTDAAAELRRLQPLLAAIAGPAVRLSIATMPCTGRTALTVEDLTRILVNLVRNAADAMPAGGHIRIAVQYGDGFSFLDPADAGAFGAPRHILLTVADDGPGIPPELREQVFDLGFSTRRQSGDWPAPRRRGLGLSIVRSLVEAAGGSVRAVANHSRGMRFEISLPLREAVTSGTYPSPHTGGFLADLSEKGCLKCQ